MDDLGCFVAKFTVNLNKDFINTGEGQNGDVLPYFQKCWMLPLQVLDLSDCPSSYEQLPPTAGCLFREAAGIREELSTAFQVITINQ